MLYWDTWSFHFFPLFFIISNIISSLVLECDLILYMEGTSARPDRRTVERNRRIHMKTLISKLVSLVPPQHFTPPKVLFIDISSTIEDTKKK